MDLGKQLREKITQKKYREVKRLMVKAANEGNYHINLLRSRFDTYAIDRLKHEGIKLAESYNTGFLYVILSWAE